MRLRVYDWRRYWGYGCTTGGGIGEVRLRVYDWRRYWRSGAKDVRLEDVPGIGEVALRA